jgi:hypothetical protein
MKVAKNSSSTKSTYAKTQGHKIKKVPLCINILVLISVLKINPSRFDSRIQVSPNSPVVVTRIS